jgi:hypothetical protein
MSRPNGAEPSAARLEAELQLHFPQEVVSISADRHQETEHHFGVQLGAVRLLRTIAHACAFGAHSARIFHVE